MELIVHICREYPQILLFVALAAGYFVGKIKVFGFSLGSTAGVLLSALVIGQIEVQISGPLQAVAFALFIFTIGYKVGPQFFGSLKKEGLKYIWLSVFFGVVGLLTAVGLAKVFGFDPGTAAGLIGGALTQSAVIGTADGAIRHLAISAAAKTTYESNIAISYAITYVFGTAGLILFYKFVPPLLHINLKEEAKTLEKEMSGGVAGEELSPELFSWHKRLVLRAYQVTNPDLSGKTVAEVEAMFPAEVAVAKVKRGAQVMDPTPDMLIQSRDILGLVGHREEFVQEGPQLGPEVADRDAVDLVGEILEICVTKPEAVGQTLGQISAQHGHGCFLRRITRQGHELPLTRNLAVEKCDVVQVAGPQSDVEKLVAYLGYPERATVATDLVFVGIGCVLGTLVGLLMVPVAGIPLTLGIGGGVLVAGLFFGWLRAVHPLFGQIPGSAQWIFTDLGLNLFIACVGLMAGPKALHAIATTGLSIFLAGVILTLLPHILGIIFGKLVLKLNPVLLFGALTGAGTITAALNALKEEADSTIPALGYTVPYALGNVILTVWGTVIVHLIY
ncbi:MAG: aspartate-alanine antiporter [Syntrophales bacterium]|nr:aspartate-alanine antiporter [Syntrophales bacterium]